MTCNQLEELWMPYLDGKLPARQREVMETHLSRCAGCSDRLREFHLVSSMLGEWEAPPLTPWFDARLRQKIAADSASRRWAGWMVAFSPSFPVSIAVLLFLAALLIWSGGGRNALPPEQVVTAEKTEEVLHVLQEVDLLSDFEVLGELKKPARQESREKGRH